MPHKRLKKWLQEHSLKLLAIRDTPEAIAGGVAIGVFFGFTPLFGLKTLSAMLFAWLTGSNILAAVVAGALHDLIFPFMPAIFYGEYGVGYWLLSYPHHWPHSLRRMNFTPHEWRSWTTFVTVGKPMLLGSLVCGTPLAVLTYFITRSIIARKQRKRLEEEAAVVP
jgi:uncharacterized protein